MRIAPLLTLLGMSVLISGCASVPAAAQSQVAATKVAETTFRNKSFTMSWIPSFGTLPDIAFLAASARQPSVMAVDLAQLLNAGRTNDTYVVVAGPSSAMSSQVLLDALKVAHNPLPHLHVLYIGSEVATEKVTQALRRAGATFVAPRT